MSRRSRVRAVGLAAPGVALGCILLATLLSPTFSWTDSALSDLGVTAGTALLFNGGLVVGGALGLGFAAWLWGVDDGVLARLRAVAFGGAVVGMGAVGVFVEGTPLHFPSALGFYLLATATMAVDGLARRGTTTGRLALVAAVVHLLAWWAWLAGVRPGPGLAIPETVGALLFTGWVWVLSPGRID